MRAGEDAPAEERRELVIDHEVISLRPRQFDFLLEGLCRVRGFDAAAVREEIGALRLIPGTIRLLPTAGELTALQTAALADDPGKAAQGPDKHLPARRETPT